MPEEVWTYVKNRVKRRWIFCFTVTMTAGLFAHFYRLVNWLPNWDSLVFRYDSQNMTQFGRIFLSLACGISSYYDLPWINGLLSLFYLSAGAVVICELFSFRKPAAVALTGALTAVFPTVTSTFLYMYTADGYCLAFFFSCFAALLLARAGGAVFSWRKNLAAVLLLAVLSGIYQAYVTVTVMLLLLYLADRLVFFRMTWREFWRACLRYLICGAAGVGALYLLFVKAALFLEKSALSEYQSVASAFALESLNPIASVKGCGKLFLSYFFAMFQQVSAYTVLNLLVFLLLAVLTAVSCKMRGVWKEPWRLFALIVCLAAMPFGASVLFFIEPYVDYHNLMRMGYIVFYLALILFYERLDGLPVRLLAAKQWAILLTAGLVCGNFILIANITWQKQQIAYEKSYGILVRMADRIEQMPGAADCRSLAVFGRFSDGQLWYADLPPDMTGTTDGVILLNTDPTIEDQSVFVSALADYCGLHFKKASAEEEETVKASEKFQAMEAWPAADSVKVIDGILVIYLGEWKT